MKRLPPADELHFEAVRSRGAGGQNVNKTNSAAILRWHLPSTKLSDHMRERLMMKLGPQLTNDGDLLIRCEEQRDLDQNKQTCLDKLSLMIEAAMFVPKKRIKTKPGKGAVRRRLDGKKKQGDKKRQRSVKNWD